MIERLKKELKQLPKLNSYPTITPPLNPICAEQGHDWEFYVIPTQPYYHSTDIEQAGICNRCGYDTHAKQI